MEQPISFVVSLIAAIIAGMTVPRVLSRAVGKAFLGTNSLNGKVISRDSYFVKRLIALLSYGTAFFLCYYLLTK